MDDNNKVLCNYCKHTAVKKRVRCISCSTYFHNSCSGPGTCCENQTFELELYKKKDEIITSRENILYDELEDQETEKLIKSSLIWENKIIKKLNFDLQERNKILEEKVQALENEIQLLKCGGKNSHEDMCATLKENVMSEVMVLFKKLHKDIKVIKRNNKNVISTNLNKAMQKPDKISTKTTVNKELSDQQKTLNKKIKSPLNEKYKLNVHESEQICLMNDIINLDRPIAIIKENTEKCPVDICHLNATVPQISEINAKETKDATSAKDDENDYQYTRYQRRNEVRKFTKKKIIAEGNETLQEQQNPFKGVEKRVWLSISRVRRDVTVEDISSFLHKKPGCENTDFIIREISTDATQNKCFMFGAPFEMKDDVYGSKFWPKGVGIERFDFKKYYQNINQQRNFL